MGVRRWGVRLPGSLAVAVPLDLVLNGAVLEPPIPGELVHLPHLLPLVAAASHRGRALGWCAGAPLALLLLAPGHRCARWAVIVSDESNDSFSA